MRRNSPIIHRLYKAHHKKHSSRLAVHHKAHHKKGSSPPVVHRQIVNWHGWQYLFQAFKKPTLTVKIALPPAVTTALPSI